MSVVSYIDTLLELRLIENTTVDVAGAMYQDSSAISVIDSKTTKVTATLNCNYMPSDDLAEVLYLLVTNYMPNAVVNIERNGVALQQPQRIW